MLFWLPVFPFCVRLKLNAPRHVGREKVNSESTAHNLQTLFQLFYFTHSSWAETLKWFAGLLRCLALHVLCKPRRKKGKSFVSGRPTFLCATLKACLVKSSFTPAADVWFVLVHYEELVSDIMLALSIESERLCSLTGPNGSGTSVSGLELLCTIITSAIKKVK